MVCALDLWSLAERRGAPTLERTLQAYGQAGHRVHVVAPLVGANHFYFGGRPRPAEPPSIPNATFERFHLPSLADLRLPLPGVVAKADQKLRFALLFPAMAARLAERRLREGSFDLLYGYEVHGLLAVRRLRRRLRRAQPSRRRLPTVARFQGTVVHPALDSRCAYYRKFEEVLALRTPADLYIMTDDGTRGDEVLARLNPSSAGRVRFWRNGLDLLHLHPPSPEERSDSRRALGLAEGDFAAVMASRLALWKRVDRALRAWPLVTAVLPEARLLIVGDGEERGNLEALARQLQLGEAVRFVGAVPQPEVRGYLWAADLFLSLNDLSNAGNPLLEAMACGLPVVTLDTGDTRDLVRDSDTGRLLSSGDAEAVATAVVDLARDPDRRCRLAAGARRFAQENFWTWEERLAAELREVEALVEGQGR